MDIAIPAFPFAVISTSGTESGDIDNVVFADLIVGKRALQQSISHLSDDYHFIYLGITVPYEGAINFNMTTLTIYTESASKWDAKLG